MPKTIFSLLKQCPGFHIVLVLSEEEFPKMMDELPENLKLFVDNELIEILWVYKNYRCFKKWIFTMEKYNSLPIISADDDCIYTENYAQKLYNKWQENKNSVITYRKYIFDNHHFQHGPAACYPPSVITDKTPFMNMEFVKVGGDDVLIGFILEQKGIKIIEYKKKVPYYFHDTFEPLSAKTLYPKNYYKLFKNKLKNYKL